MTDQVEVLKEARALIEDPERWTQRVFARDKEGRSVGPTSPRAICWCATGAIARVKGVGGSTAQDSKCNRVLARAFGARHSWAVPEYNDGASHAEVLAAFNKAIELAEAEKK